MSYQLMTDHDVVVSLGQKFDELRRYKQLQDKDILAKSGSSSSVLAKFRSGKGNITLESFVKLVRAIGELDQLESLLNTPEQQFSPSQNAITKTPKRIHKSKQIPNFKWEDE